MRLLCASTSITLVALLVLGCATPLPVERPLNVAPLELQSGEWRVTDQVIAVTDASGTMYANKTFPKAKALTQAFVAAMPAADVRSKRGGAYQAGLIGFGGDDRVVAPLEDFDRRAMAGAANQLEIMGSIDGFGGMTPVRKVMAEAQAALEGRGERAAIVVFSDGLPDDPPRAVAAAGALAESYSGELCIHTVQTGDDPAGTEFLQALAGVTDCGSMRGADSLSTASAFMGFVRGVFTGDMPMPPAAGCPTLRLRGVNFAFDRSEITPESAVILDFAATQVNEYLGNPACKGAKISVEGHTDSIGTEEYNQGLSERRADAVKQHLIGAGVSASRLVTKGFGELDPIDTNSTTEGRARNRRVELVPR